MLIYWAFQKKGDVFMGEPTKFSQVLNYIRSKNNLTIRALSEKTGLSTTYIFDLEKSNRLPTEEVIAKLMNNIQLSESETQLLWDCLVYDRHAMPQDVLNYLLDNDLLEYIRAIKDMDENGDELKRFALQINPRKVKIIQKKELR